MCSRVAFCALAVLLVCRRADAADSFPWLRTPLTGFPGVFEGKLSDPAVTFLANHYDVLSLGGTLTDPKNNRECGENRIADLGRRLIAANASVRPFFYLNDIINYI